MTLIQTSAIGITLIGASLVLYTAIFPKRAKDVLTSALTLTFSGMVLLATQNPQPLLILATVLLALVLAVHLSVPVILRRREACAAASDTSHPS